METKGVTMQHVSRPKVIIGNWKMNKTVAETRSFVSGLGLNSVVRTFQVGLAVPYTMILTAAEAARGTAISIGAQNCSDHDEGAFTGEISCHMLKDAGASFVLVGHSERRQLFHETNALVNRKVKKSIAATLKPVVCIGETEEQHLSGKIENVLHDQILHSLKGLNPSEVEHLILAYEPIWAIGTGKTATPENIQFAHAYCRKVIASEWGKDTAEHTVILYGGSVKPENAAMILEQSDVDGLLVGGASLSLESFNKILNV